MSATAPQLLSLSAAQAAVKSSDYFALGFLKLCEVSYTGESSRDQAIADIKASFTAPTAGGIWASTYLTTCPGRWTLDWGPFATPDNSNLLYVASYRYGTTSSAVFTAVVIRGTDIKTNPGGILTQLEQDLKDAAQVNWTYNSPLNDAPNNPNGQALIAHGTAQGFADILGITADDTSTGQNVLGYLQTQQAAFQTGVPLVVTGHSLGGCQATVMAAYLASQLANTTIVPNPFAPPTAGNPAFAWMYSQLFSYCPSWINTLDLVPMAYENLPGIDQLWLPCNPPPDYAKAAVRRLENDVGPLDYTQVGQPRTLTGWYLDETFFQKVLDPWLAELCLQHFPNSGYWYQMIQYYPAICQLYPLPPQTPRKACVAAS